MSQKLRVREYDAELKLGFSTLQKRGCNDKAATSLPL